MNQARKTELRALVERAQDHLYGFYGKNDLRVGPNMLASVLADAHLALLEALDEIDAMEKALKPFAALATDYLENDAAFPDDVLMAGRIHRRHDDAKAAPPRVTFADFRLARTTLQELGD